jgi:hypothetical protein
VLGKVDYRYGTDSQLVGADAQVTNFGALINSSISLPTVDLVYHLDADVGVVSTGGYGTQLVSWTDSVSGVVFTPTGTINYDANGITTNGHSVVGITSGSTISGTGLGNNSGTIAIAFCFVAPGLTGSIIDNGGGVNAGYDDSINKFTSYTGGISNVTFPIDTTVYLMLLSPSSGLCTIVNMATGIVLDYFTASCSTGPDDTITLGPVPMIVFEVAMYDTDIGYTSSAFTQLAQYFTSKYYGAFNLPLTFPPNAVSVTN